MAGGKATETQLKMMERREIALQLRLEGYSYRDIAAQLERDYGIKVSYAQVARDILKEVEKSAQRRAELGDELFALTITRTEALVRAHWKQAVGGERRIIDETGEETVVVVGPDVASSRLLLDIGDKYAKWFGWGNNATEGIEVTSGEALIYMRHASDEQLDGMIQNLLPALRGASPHGGVTTQ